MTNNDNLKSNLLTSNLLKKLVQVLLQVEPEICVEVGDNWRATDIYMCKGTEVGDAGFSLCGGLVKTTKSLSAF